MTEGFTVVDQDSDQPDFMEGACRFLSRMSASILSDVCNATLSHWLLSNNGSRFIFFRDSVEVSLAQVKRVVDDKEVKTFHICQNKSSGEASQGPI